MNSVISRLKIFASGCITALILPPFGLPPYLVFILFIPLLQELFSNSPLKRFYAGLLFGFGYFLVLLKWISIVGNDALIALTLICAIWWGIASIFSLFFIDSKYWSLWFATSWTVVELMRDRFPWGGFGWGQLGIVWVNTPFAGLYSIFGQVGMTFLTFLSVAKLYELLIRTKNKALNRKIVLIFLPTLCLVLLSSNASHLQPITTDQDEEISISAIQGGVEHTGLGVLGSPRAVLNKHYDETMKHLSRINSTDLLVWPESSVDLDPYADVLTMQTLRKLDEVVNPPVLVNGTLYSTSNLKQNTSLLLKNNQTKKVYQKRHLVPFGEFLPLRDLIEKYTDRASMLSTDYEPGSEVGKIAVKGQLLEILICFEIADDSLIHQDMDNISAVIVQTNNATYQNLGQTEQQVLYTQLRAIETGRPIISISTSGNSVIVDSNGNIQSKLDQSEIGLLTVQIVKVSGQTLASTIHNVLIYGLFMVFAGGLIIQIRYRFKIMS